MNSQGFVKIERDIVHHWVFKSDPECRIWIYLIILVKFSNSNKPVKIGKVERILDRGEFISSISKIAAELDLTYNQVRRCLDLFKKNNMIVKTCGRGKGIPYVAKLVNYDKHQGDYTFKKAIKTQSKNNHKSFKMQHTNNYNNYNNGYNEKLYIYKCEVCETILQNETTITDLDITCPTCNVSSIRHLV